MAKPFYQEQGQNERTLFKLALKETIPMFPRFGRFCLIDGSSLLLRGRCAATAYKGFAPIGRLSNRDSLPAESAPIVAQY
jgi:hypothetical protein